MVNWLSDLMEKTGQSASILLVAALTLVLGCDGSTVEPIAAPMTEAQIIADGSPNVGDLSVPRRDVPAATSSSDGSSFYDDRYGTIFMATDPVDIGTSERTVDLGRPGDADEIPGTFDDELKAPLSDEPTLGRPR